MHSSERNIVPMQEHLRDNKQIKFGRNVCQIKNNFRLYIFIYLFIFVRDS